MPEVTGDCKVAVSTIYVFQSQAFQNAANSMYVFKSTFDATTANSATGRKYQFKTDFERMQYLTGLYGLYSTGQSAGRR
jgi:hypothetical protein